MAILILNGPNLNWLGRRQKHIYGDLSLDEINQRLPELFPGVTLEFFQSNCEGELIDALQKAAERVSGIVINPGALGHYSLAVADALAALTIPVVEVHLSNVFAREPARHNAVTAANCRGYICGLGWQGYRLAIESILYILKEEN